MLFAFDWRDARSYLNFRPCLRNLKEFWLALQPFLTSWLAMQKPQARRDVEDYGDWWAALGQQCAEA